MIIDQVAKLVMYKGPRMHDLIAESFKDNKELKIYKEKTLTILKISFETAYNTKVTDIYSFNSENELIKQKLQINDKIKVIFDKFGETEDLLKLLSVKNKVAS